MIRQIFKTSKTTTGEIKQVREVMEKFEINWKKRLTFSTDLEISHEIYLAVKKS